MKKTHKVVMLPTEDATNIWWNPNLEIYGYCISKLSGKTEADMKNQHLYILSDDSIEEDCWYYDSNVNRIYNTGGAEYGETRGLFKVVAATDPKLKTYNSGVRTPSVPIPRIPHSLVEYYSKYQPEEVELEYEDIKIIIQDYAESPKHKLPPTMEESVYNLKLKNNEVVWVEPIKGRNLYTHEEVEKLFIQFREEHLYTFDMTNEEGVKQWLKENL